MKKNLMTIKSFKLLNSKSLVKYQQFNIKNILHAEGEEYILKYVFKSTNIAIPDKYYVGLDFRSSLSRSDTLSSIYLEPSSNNYRRQAIDSWSFSSSAGNWIAKSPPIVFSAVSTSGAGWGPIRNIFLATIEERCDTGTCKYLISSSRLDQNVTLASGDKIVLEMSLAIFNN
jgi:hypothetical protein